MIDITRLDRFQQLVFDASGRDGAHPVVIFGNTATSDYELIRLGTTEIPSDLAQMIAARGLVFIGVVGLIQGRPQSQLAVPLDIPAIADLTVAYLKIVEESFNARLEVGELRRLRDIPSDRMDA